MTYGLLAAQLARPGRRPAGAARRIPAGRGRKGFSGRDPRDTFGYAGERPHPGAGADGPGYSETSGGECRPDRRARAKLWCAGRQTGRNSRAEDAEAQQRQRPQHQGKRVFQ